MKRLKKDSKRNEVIEEVVDKFRDMEAEYTKDIIYRATRRYNDRIWRAKKKKK